MVIIYLLPALTEDYCIQGLKLVVVREYQILSRTTRFSIDGSPAVYQIFFVFLYILLNS